MIVVGMKCVCAIDWDISCERMHGYPGQREKERGGEREREGRRQGGDNDKILQINFQKNDSSSFTKLTMMHLC